MLNFADRTGYGALMVMWPYMIERSAKSTLWTEWLPTSQLANRNYALMKLLADGLAIWFGCLFAALVSGSELSPLFLVGLCGSGGLLVLVICWCAELECTSLRCPRNALIFALIFALTFALTFAFGLQCEVSSLPSSFLVGRSGGLLVLVICWCAELECTSTRCYIYMGAHKSDDKWIHFPLISCEFTSLLLVCSLLVSELGCTRPVEWAMGLVNFDCHLIRYLIRYFIWLCVALMWCGEFRFRSPISIAKREALGAACKVQSKARWAASKWLKKNGSARSECSEARGGNSKRPEQIRLAMEVGSHDEKKSK